MKCLLLNLAAPGSGHSCKVMIPDPGEATVGEWILLNAARTGGTWQQLPRAHVNRALEPTPVGLFSSAFAVDSAGSAWLSSCLWVK